MFNNYTPFRIGRRGRNIVDAEGQAVVEAVGQKEIEFLSFIVRAVNAHEDLLSALLEIQSIALQGGQNAQTVIRLIAEQAIAKAEGK